MIDEILLKKLLDDDELLVECPCGNKMEVFPGEVDYNVKDEEGKQMSPEAAVQYAYYRVKC